MRSARGALGLVLLGLGLSHCKGDPDGAGDAGVDASVPPLEQTVMRDVHLLDVDARQQRLIAVELDGGTLAHELASGETRRIAPGAWSGRFTQDGGAVVLSSFPQDGISTAWLWRPGDAEARTLGTQVWGGVVLKEGAEPYVAFAERTDGGGAALRRVLLRECDAQACTVQTLAQLDGGLPLEPVLLAGERFLWISRDKRGWAFDTVSGTLVEAGGDVSHVLRISPSGNRFARVTPDRHVQVHETGTGTLLWDVVVPPDDKSITQSAFFGEDTFIVNTWRAGSPAPSPPELASHACTAQGCTWFADSTCEPRQVRGGTVLSCYATDCFGVRCSPRYALMREPGVVFSGRNSSYDQQPAVSDDLTSAVWMTYELRNQPGTRTLSWDRDPPVQSLTFPTQINLNVFDFVPGQQRFVFVNPKHVADGGVENVLSVWDETGVEERGVVEGYPGGALIRMDPPVLYMTGYELGPDGPPVASVLQRFAL
ncbi:hypothetical protein JYK02_01300 [Corallococcus macrosporus]|uniref:Lipoprotein n=1 Tax=Corallococcus macrosporus TaxID=35 RepID=A0ABS3D3D4_9BACT|nr:hypothetical protein [Corallococcus macrosporus]MBN8226139.1 hypothetical protein [Corallococcus macrosporus]